MSTDWRPLAWEREFFGVPSARLGPQLRGAAALDRALDEIDAAGGGAVHWLLPADEDGLVRLAESRGFHFVDMRVTLDWRAGPPFETSFAGPWEIRPARPDDLQRLVPIARGAYRQSRFYYDGGYARNRCDDLYEEWLRRAWREAPESLFVVADGGHAAGFVACRLDADRALGRIELLGAAVNRRGEGLASGLIRWAQAYFVRGGARAVEVVTQGRNVAAQRVYQAAGFRTAAVELWYHAWRRGTAPRERPVERPT